MLVLAPPGEGPHEDLPGPVTRLERIDMLGKYRRCL